MENRKSKLWLTLTGCLICSLSVAQNSVIPGSLTVNGDVKLTSQNNGYIISYAALSETIGGATTVLGNNIKAGNSNNTIKRFYSPDDPGSFIALNYIHGITFHSGVSTGLNTEIPTTDNEVMRIGHDKNVGIGVTNTKGYKLAVNGNIRAREIKIDNEVWPDYVFATSYLLPTLRETEKYVQEKGHLPGIPSADDVKTNGVDLGKMNAALLQKIEELTLHLIEKEKQINTQQQELEGVKKDILELKNLILKR